MKLSSSNFRYTRLYLFTTFPLPGYTLPYTFYTGLYPVIPPVKSLKAATVNASRQKLKDEVFIFSDDTKFALHKSATRSFI